MADEVYLTQVRFSANSLKTADDVTNSWHWRSVGVPAGSTTIDAWRDALKVFYNACVGAIINDWGLTVRMKTYKLSDPKPRAPVRDENVVLTGPYASTGLNIPRECSLVVSFQGDPVSGVPIARKRGRIYLPTITSTNLDNTGRLVSATQTGIKNAASALLAASIGASLWKWCVYSPTSLAFADVTKGFVDNNIDIQRRRGQSSTSRSTF